MKHISCPDSNMETNFAVFRQNRRLQRNEELFTDSQPRYPQRFAYMCILFWEV